jgi:hypothetical protein
VGWVRWIFPVFECNRFFQCDKEDIEAQLPPLYKSGLILPNKDGGLSIALNPHFESMRKQLNFALASPSHAIALEPREEAEDPSLNCAKNPTFAENSELKNR